MQKRYYPVSVCWLLWYNGQRPHYALGQVAPHHALWLHYSLKNAECDGRIQILSNCRAHWYTGKVGMLTKILTKIAANIAALWIATTYIAGFVLTGGPASFVIGGIVLAGINLIVRPILKFVALPFMVITLGAFYIIIFIILLLIADFLLPALTITGFTTLLWGALIIGVINTIVR